MIPKKVKRCFALLLAIIMAFSLGTVSVPAAEVSYIHEEENSINTSVSVSSVAATPVVETTSEETVIVIAEHPVLGNYQTELNRILIEYLGTTELTADQAAQGAATLNEWDTYNAHWEILIVEDDLMMDYNAGILSEEEIQVLLGANAAFCAFATVVHENTPEDGGASTYGNITLLDGILYVSDTKSTLSKTDEDTFSVTAKGSLLSKATNNITFKNDSGKPAKLTVKYSVSSANAFTIAGSTAATSGTYVNDELAASGTVVFTLTSNSGFSGTTATLTVSEVSLVPVGQSANFTYTFDNTKGSIKVGSATVTSGTPVAMKSGDIVTATPANGYEFVGWLNTTDNTLISTETSYEFAVDGDLAVTALFEAVNGTPWFYVKENKGVYSSLSAATSSANAATVVLMNNGKLPAGDHTVPSGKTLLIPYDKGYTVVTTSPSVITSATKPSAYRTLTMASGAKLIVNGSLSVAGTLVASQTYGYNGQPVGPVGHIKMESGSSIVSNNGSNMYVLGYIYGSGSVAVNSGATVYECFQIRDFRGGSATSSMKIASQKVFPLSQYYVQNIEVPMTLYSGAFCKGISAFNINSKFQTPTVPFIGNNSDYLFQLTGGNLVKDYDESNDRLKVEVKGTLSLTSFKIRLPGAFSSMGDIDTQNYILPINSNITVEITESHNVTIDQDIQLLPEAELIIDQGATCSVGSGKKVIVYDSDNWGSYCGEKLTNDVWNVPVKPLLWVAEGKAPAVDRYKASAASMGDARLQINGIFDASAGSLYTTEGGGNITNSGTGVLKLGTVPSNLTTYQATQEGSDIEYSPIIASVAQLKNGDGTYLTSTATTYIYDVGRGKWICETHTYGDWAITTIPTSKIKGVETRTCGACGESEARTIIAIYGTSVRVGDSLDLYFYVRRDMLEGTAYYAQITRSYADNVSTEDIVDPYSETLTPIPFANWEPYGDYYRLCYSGIAGKEMTDEVSVTLYHDDGIRASIPATETISRYALRTLKSSSATAELKAVLMDMVNFGANCQTYFKYNTGNLANADKNFNAYETYGGKTLQTWSTAHNGGDVSFGASVSAENRLVYTFYLQDVTSETVVVSYINHYNQQVEEAVIPVLIDGKYRVDVPQLAVADGHRQIMCTFTDSTGAQTVTGSIEGYLTSIDGTGKDNIVFEKLMYFVDSAYAYFH